ncbi:MAG TPA: lipopolysaccharide heptosyltransferase II [Verrucomicrobiae bacterium]|nr:lipopolysaccharide heptosyltransferase II [Verrucomicrobiae bacterium]
MKILILKPSSLGDVVQALPVLRLLKRHLPHSEIYWWIESKLAPLLQGDPDLADIILFERDRWAAPQNWGELASSIRRVRHQHFDWVIDLQCLARSGAFAWLANGKLMVGLDEPREGARGFYDLVARRASFHTHAVDWYLGVLPLLNIPIHQDFQWLPVRPDVAARVHKRWPALSDFPWLVFQPGARWTNKRWPKETFAELVRRTADAYPEMRIAILGGAEDRPLGATIQKAAPKYCLDLTGELSLVEMVEWIRSSRLMVTNDTGPMHVAAALGRPVVAVFGPTEPRRTGPYGQIANVLQSDLPCVPCLKSRCHYSKPFACLRQLGPDIVFESMDRRLRALSSRSGHSLPGGDAGAVR